MEEVAPRAAVLSKDLTTSEAQSQVPIVQFWGEGLLASVDGLRFVVPVRTISAAPSPKYFGLKRGIGPLQLHRFHPGERCLAAVARPGRGRTRR